MSQQVKDLQVGSRVYCPGNMAVMDDYGTVVAMDRPAVGQKPKTIGGGIVTVVDSTPRAKITVVLDDGRQLDTDEMAFFGLRPWSITGEVVDSEGVAKAIALGHTHEASENARKQSEKESFDAERDRLAAAYPNLVRVRDDRNAPQKNLRKLLKSAVPHLKLSVKQSRACAIDVSIREGEMSDEDYARIKRICDRFEGGYFDGMQDIYHHQTTPWTSLFGDANYVFINRW